VLIAPAAVFFAAFDRNPAVVTQPRAASRTLHAQVPMGSVRPRVEGVTATYLEAKVQLLLSMR